MRTIEKALPRGDAKISRCATGFVALLLAAACDRPLAQPAMAADALPAPAHDAAKPASPPPAPAPLADTPAPALDPLSDAAITASVVSAIREDPALAGADLSVNTSRGVVSLTGTVKSPEQVAEAAAHAQAPDGVMRIDSHLSVNPP